MRQARAAFRYPNYRYYMAARFLTPLASEMQAVAVAWQVYALTHRPLDLGLVGLAQFLPGIFLFLAAGHTADRVPRLRILQARLARFPCAPCCCWRSRCAGWLRSIRFMRCSC